MRTYLVAAAFLAASTPPLAAMSIDGKAYIVSLLTPTQGAQIESYFDQTETLMSGHGGHYVVAPIRVEKELDNPYLPNVYRSFPSEYVTIARFETPDDLERYVAAAGDHFSSWEGSLQTQIRFSAGVMPAPNTEQELPVIGDIPPRLGESFILLNASSFKPLPEVPAYIQEYGTEIETVMAAGTRFLATFAKLTDITESYDYQILFLSEWASEAAFEAVHSDEAWRMVVPFRNFALSGFTEAKGVITGM